MRSVVGSIALIVVGAIFTFAVTTGSAVGLVLVLAGLGGLLFSALQRRRPRWTTARSAQESIEGRGTVIDLPRYDALINDDHPATDDHQLWVNRTEPEAGP